MSQRELVVWPSSYPQHQRDADNTTVLIDVTVPATALRTHSDIITLKLTQIRKFYKTVSTTILAGESYEVSVEMDSDTKPLTPGVPSPIPVKVQNMAMRRRPSHLMPVFPPIQSIGCHLSANRNTPTRETVNATLMVTPPVIKNPLVDAEDNGAGDTIHLGPSDINQWASHKSTPHGPNSSCDRR